ncbi:MAG: YgaP-like transmembrane domain, partial [Bacteroidota bacterium]
MGLTANIDTKRNFSKYDPSGTDPNRYASVSNTTEADSYLHKGKKSIVPGLRVNIGKTERAIMIAAGAYLLYRVLKKNDSRKVAEGITAGTMLFRGISGYCPAYDAIDRAGVLKTGNISITTALTINKPVEDVYAAWRDLSSLPKFMTHLESVTEIDQYKSEWKAKIPGGFGATAGWKAEILMDEPN